jgi:hypothetical protein
VHKPHRNRLSLAPQGGADGFRGRVSQVRILPGPLSGGGLLRSANPSFLDRKPALYPLTHPGRVETTLSPTPIGQDRRRGLPLQLTLSHLCTRPQRGRSGC